MNQVITVLNAHGSAANCRECTQLDAKQNSMTEFPLAFKQEEIQDLRLTREVEWRHPNQCQGTKHWHQYSGGRETTLSAKSGSKASMMSLKLGGHIGYIIPESRRWRGYCVSVWRKLLGGGCPVSFWRELFNGGSKKVLGSSYYWKLGTGTQA